MLRDLGVGCVGGDAVTVKPASRIAAQAAAPGWPASVPALFGAGSGRTALTADITTADVRTPGGVRT